MCGIVGQMGLTRDSSIESGKLAQMCAWLMRRGPDHSDVWHDSLCAVGFGHTRLAIRDLSSAGHQPMISPSGRFVVVFNGEIYNHSELRSKYWVGGSSFKGESDTETLAHLVDCLGVCGSLTLLKGMFAIAVWDRRQRILTLARDRLGEKPLYWGLFNDNLFFSSDLSVLQAYQEKQPEVDSGSLSMYVRFGYIPAPYTIYKNIFKLEAGHYLEIPYLADPLSCTSRCYWALKHSADGRGSSLSDDASYYPSSLNDLLRKTIDGQMESDVPLGAFLSGGVDSSLIVSIMQSLSSRPINTFSVGFKERAYNEADKARDISNFLGTRHHELLVSADSALKVIEDLPAVYAEPFADSSQIPTALLSQFASQYVKVALSGDCGDELFGGYNTYRTLPRAWSVISRMPVASRRAFARGAFKLPWVSRNSKVRKLIETMGAKNEFDFFKLVSSHFISPGSILIDSREHVTILDKPEEWPLGVGFVEWMMFVDAKMYMADDILVKVDRAAMASSLETRIPFLDHDVVEFAWRLPLSSKIRGSNGKWILRQLLRQYLPPTLVKKTKTGFSIPIDDWLRGPLRQWASDLLFSRSRRVEDFFHDSVIKDLWREHQSSARDHGARLWIILMFQNWRQKYKI